MPKCHPAADRVRGRFHPLDAPPSLFLIQRRRIEPRLERTRTGNEWLYNRQRDCQEISEGSRNSCRPNEMMAILTKLLWILKKCGKSLSAGKSQSIYFIRWTESFAADWNLRFSEEFKDLEAKYVRMELITTRVLFATQIPIKLLFPTNSGQTTAKKALESFKIETSGRE